MLRTVEVGDSGGGGWSGEGVEEVELVGNGG